MAVLRIRPSSETCVDPAIGRSCLAIKNSIKFVPAVSIDNKSQLVQVMVSHWIIGKAFNLLKLFDYPEEGEKPSPE